MPSVKEIYHKIDDVRIEADSINLNVDGLEALASTQQADVAAIKTDIANGVTINQPVAVTDNNGSLTVDGTVGISGTVPVSGTFWQSTQPVSGTITAAQAIAANLNATVVGSGSFTAAQATAANLNATVVQGTATNLKTQAEVYQGGTAVGSGSPLQVTLANTGANATAVKVDNSGVNQPIIPRNGSVTVTTGTTSGTANTSDQALAQNTNRRYLLIQNISDTDMYFNFGSAATTSNLFVAKSGGGIVFESGFCPTDAVNVICSEASKSFYILSA